TAAASQRTRSTSANDEAGIDDAGGSRSPSCSASRADDAGPRSDVDIDERRYTGARAGLFGERVTPRVTLHPNRGCGQIGGAAQRVGAAPTGPSAQTSRPRRVPAQR